MFSILTMSPVIENIDQKDDSLIFLTSVDESKLLNSRNLDFISLIENKDQILIESKELLEDFLDNNEEIREYLVQNYNSVLPLGTFLSEYPSSIILIKK